MPSEDARCGLHKLYGLRRQSANAFLGASRNADGTVHWHVSRTQPHGPPQRPLSQRMQPLPQSTKLRRMCSPGRRPATCHLKALQSLFPVATAIDAPRQLSCEPQPLTMSAVRSTVPDTSALVAAACETTARFATVPAQGDLAKTLLAVLVAAVPEKRGRCWQQSGPQLSCRSCGCSICRASGRHEAFASHAGLRPAVRYCVSAGQ